MALLLEGGLRYNEKVIPPGAQTERRGDAGPVSVSHQAGHSSAVLFNRGDCGLAYRGQERSKIV